MALLVNLQGLTKAYGPAPLFRNLSLDLTEGERLGLIGPNGSGKSTLLEMIAGRREPDAGNIAYRKNVRLSYVSQTSEFRPGETARSVVMDALEATSLPSSEREGRAAETLGRAGFTAFDVAAQTLSGGWRKRLAIAQALVTGPELVLLDEPTNHLDLAGIAWLEKLLQNAPFASVVISHDRYFLENVATEMAELNRIYPEGMLRVSGNYSAFLESKSNFLAAQTKHQDALENRVRTEMEWLRRGPKARATKAKARIDNAHELIAELKDLQNRSRTSTAGIEFTGSERATKRLIQLKDVEYSFDAQPIIKNLDFTFTAGTRLGLVGPNGSGKTTLLRLLTDELTPQGGTIERADSLRIVYFEQNRQLDESVSLRRTLAPASDSVVYQDRTIHVASWASRFLFSNDQLDQPVGRLSGGERARVLIARLMLEPADLLLLDEPTNDLDIPTLELLEENLVEFRGALVLVTHDRYMLDRVSSVVLGLDGKGHAERFASYAQWETWSAEQTKRANAKSAALNRPVDTAPRASVRKKLSYLDSRDFETIEERINQAERVLAAERAQLEDSAVVIDPQRLQSVLQAVEEAQQSVNALYARWAELETKLTGTA